MCDASDRELVRASQQGDGDAFGVLVRRYETHVYAVTFGALLDHRDAEDAAQNALLKGWQRIAALRQPDSFAAWLTRIAFTCVADVRRGMSREVVMDVHTAFAEEPQPTVDQEQYVVRAEIDRLVAAGMGSLPESLRVALTMRYIGQQTYAEIAEGLAVSENAAHRRVSTARVRLAEYFARAGAERECLDAVYSRWLVAPTALAVAGPVIALVESRGPTGVSKAGLAPSLGMLSSFVAAVTVVAALVLGLSLRTTAAITLTGDDDGIPAETVTLQRPDLQTAAFVPTAPARVLVRPGDEASNWQAWLPDSDARLPEVTTDVFSTPPFGMVSRNAEGAYLEFEPARGEVTCELWIRPASGVYDSHIYLLSDGQEAWDIPRGWAWHDAVAIRKHGASEWWQYGSAAEPIENNIYAPYTREPGWVPFAPVDPKGQHLRIVHRTVAGSYDLYLDGVMMARNVRVPKTQGKAITGLWIGEFSMYGAHAARPTYFDDVKVSVPPIRRWTPDIFTNANANANAKER